MDANSENSVVGRRKGLIKVVKFYLLNTLYLGFTRLTEILTTIKIKLDVIPNYTIEKNY